MRIVKHFAFILLGVTLLIFSSSAIGQDNKWNHGEVGVFADDVRFNNANNLNLLGVGGRVSFNVRPNLALEAGGSYNFERTADLTLNGLTNPVRANLRTTNFLAGPKFQLGKSSSWRLFAVLKGGFVRFGITPGPVTFGNFPTQLHGTDLNGVFYPGGGFEAFAGILGFRTEAGDEIYFDNGAHNNLKITIGPVIRF